MTRTETFNQVTPRLLSLKEAAAYIACSPKYLYCRTNGDKGGLPFKVIRRGGRVYFDRLQLDAWVDEEVRG